jgi:hypothetical protein
MEYWSDGSGGRKTINPFLPLSIYTFPIFHSSIGMGWVGHDIAIVREIAFRIPRCSSETGEAAKYLRGSLPGSRGDAFLEFFP